MVGSKKSIYWIITGLAGAMVFSSFMQSSPVRQQEWKAPSWADTIQSPFPRTAAAEKKGKDLFNLYCWSCHGEKGMGDGAAGRSFGVKPANFHDARIRDQSNGAFFWKISTGRGNMPPFKDVLTREQRWELIFYIRKLTNS